MEQAKLFGGRSGPFRLTGTILDSAVRRAAPGLRVELLEHRSGAAPVAVTETDATGTFELHVGEEAYRERYARRRPRFYLRVVDGEREVADLGDQMRLDLRKEIDHLLVGVNLADTVRGIFWERTRSPRLFPTVPGAEPPKVKIEVVEPKHPALGGLGFAVEITGPAKFDEDWILVVPYTTGQVKGIDTKTVRLFTTKKGGPALPEPIWESTVNPEGRFVWAHVSGAGVYTPIGLPRDRVVFAGLEAMAKRRARLGGREIRPEAARELFQETLGALVEADLDELDRFRFDLVNLEAQTRNAPMDPADLERGQDGAFEPFALPGARTTKEFVEHLRELDIGVDGLPDERLFFPPDPPESPGPPWPTIPPKGLGPPIPIPDPDTPLPIPWPPPPFPLPPGPIPFEPHIPIPGIPPFRFGLCLFGAGNWWMYHRDSSLSGAARCSAIRSTNIADLQPLLPAPITLDGPVLSIPSIVNGKIYVGSVDSSDSGRSGTVYKFDLATGAKQAEFPLPTAHATRPGESPLIGARQGGLTGVGSSPAVVGSRVYVSTLTGFVYCLDANSLACLWYTDLRKRHLAKNQPIDHGTAKSNGWSSPLVVGNRVYVGFGEGESNAFGFVYCLDASNGRVVWIYCTNKFTSPGSPGSENQPNVLPPSVCPAIVPSDFTKASSDPPNRGASPWSHASFDAALGRIYIGTGNSIPDGVLPEPRYSNGVLSLDATTGEFRGFFQPPQSSNYRPTSSENDIDVPAGPMLFLRGGARYVGIGSKNGSFFVLDADTMAVVEQRQMLPYQSDGNPFDTVDDVGGSSENRSGVMATAAVNAVRHTIFVPVGGYAQADSIDYLRTPFMRAVDWASLDDAWPTTGTNPPKYSNVGATMYTHAGEAGMASPATVNDVVFMSTTSSGLYAYHAGHGLHLRTLVAPGGGAAAGSMGPAIYGSYVVAGFYDGALRIFKLQP